MKNLNEQKMKEMKDNNINNEKKNNKNIDLISNLKEIFNHFSNNSKYLSNKDYKIFLIETSLLDDIKITPEYSNILFYSFSSAKNCISFQTFCKLLIKISSIKFPQKYKESEENALFLLFDVYLNPLLKIYQIIDSDEKNKYDIKKEDFIFNNINQKLIIQKIVSRMTKDIIEKNYLLFLKIYQKYFCFENLKISNSQKGHLSNKAFIKVFNDFNISPKYINPEKIENIFNIIIKNSEYIINIMNNFINIDLCNNDGMLFTLFHFILGIYLVSVINVITTNYDENAPNNIWEVFINNNDSKAFKNLLLLFYKSENNKTVMNEEIKKMQFEILTNEDKEYYNFNEESKDNTSFNNEEYSNQLSPIISKLKENDNKNNFTYSEMVPIILNKHKKQLISIYKYYSELFLETNFSVYMTQNGFISLIKDMNLLLKKEDIPKNYNNMSSHQKFLFQNKVINLLSFTTINSLFSKFSSIPTNRNNKSVNKKINFVSFVNIILILSNKIFNPKFSNISFDDKVFSYEEIINSKILIKYVNNFIVNYLNPLYQNIFPNLEEDNFTIENLMAILQNEKIKYIVNKINPLFIRILKHYTDNKKFIEYSHYFKCLSDFNIFPDYIQKKKMIKIFINFIKDFDDIYLLRGNNKAVSDIKSCAYSIFYIGLGGEDNQNINNEELEIKLFNFIHKIGQSNNLGKISIVGIKNNLQKDFLNSLYEIHEYLFKDKKI